jgi:hypothetical protein
MYLTLFVRLFPGQAMAETRTITTRGHDVLPDDEYALVESYCTDPTCDCRRVMLYVVGRRQMRRGYLASISFGFDRDAEMAGPYLDPLNPQSEYALVFLDMVTRMLDADTAYVARLESHYRQVKQAAADPTHPVHRVLTRLGLDGQEKPTPWRKKRKRSKR